MPALTMVDLVARKNVDDYDSPGPPPGVELPPATDDYDYPYSSLQHGGYAILFIFPAIALITVTLRAYSRATTGHFGLDDTLICMAMAISIAETIVSYLAMRFAFVGVPFEDIPLEADLRKGMLWNYVCQVLYYPILALVKTSILLFLLRLGGQKKNVRRTIHALNIFNIATMISVTFALMFQCTPISYMWESAGRNPPTEGGCIDQAAVYVANSALNVLTDILVLVLPFWIFLGLQMPRKIKITVLGVFALGAVVTVVSILRLAWLVEINYGTPTGDISNDIRFVYSAVETNLAIIAASAPALRSLMSKWFPTVFTSYRRSKEDQTPYFDGPSGKKSGHTSSSRNPNGASGSSRDQGHDDSAGEELQLRDVSKGRSEFRYHSPTTSEEGIMTYNDGIVLTTEVNVNYNDSKSPRSLGQASSLDGGDFSTKQGSQRAEDDVPLRAEPRSG